MDLTRSSSVRSIGKQFELKPAEPSYPQVILWVVALHSQLRPPSVSLVQVQVVLHVLKQHMVVLQADLAERQLDRDNVTRCTAACA